MYYFYVIAFLSQTFRQLLDLLESILIKILIPYLCLYEEFIAIYIFQEYWEYSLISMPAVTLCYTIVKILL